MEKIGDNEEFFGIPFGNFNLSGVNVFQKLLDMFSVCTKRRYINFEFVARVSSSQLARKRCFEEKTAGSEYNFVSGKPTIVDNEEHIAKCLRLAKRIQCVKHVLLLLLFSS